MLINIYFQEYPEKTCSALLHNKYVPGHAFAAKSTGCIMIHNLRRKKTTKRKDSLPKALVIEEFYGLRFYVGRATS